MRLTGLNLLALLLTLTLPGGIQSGVAAKQANSYPRFIEPSGTGNTYLHSFDMHFDSDTLVYVGVSEDNSFTTCNGASGNPIIAGMFIQEPIYKWGKCTADLSGPWFFDVDISSDGLKAVTVTGKLIIYIKQFTKSNEKKQSMLHAIFLIRIK